MVIREKRSEAGVGELKRTELACGDATVNFLGVRGQRRATRSSQSAPRLKDSPAATGREAAPP